MQYLIALIILCCPPSLFAQYKLIDSVSQSPVPYATVILTGTSIGTITDDGGRFSLKPSPGADSIRVSAVGYVTTRLALRDLSSGTPILLQPTSYSLRSVEVNASAFTKTKKVGNAQKSDKLACRFLHGQEGEQIGRRLRIGQESFAQSARISVVITNVDSVLCRLRFYPVSSDSISSVAVLHPDVLLTISGVEVIEIDLRPYEIILPEEVIMAVELLDAPVPNQKIYFGAALFKPNALYREHKEAPWREGQTSKKKGKSGFLTLAPAFELTVLK